MQMPVKPRRPEDAELSRKREELAELQARLAELELQLLTLRLELAEFEALYHAKAGHLYAELDEVEALIAERLAKIRPLDREAAESASSARRRADASRQAIDASLTLPPPVSRSQTLRDLYRAAAKQLHPDLAGDDNDRAIRERLMTEANLAYAGGDEARLQEILEEYQSSPDTVVGNDVGAELVRAIRRITLTIANISKVEAGVSSLNSSEIYKLKTTVDEARKRGSDVLGDLVENLRQTIRARRQHLQTL
jgi:DNA repair exonuclease SbcCD ATPase subunit